MQGFLETRRLLEPLFKPLQTKYALSDRQAAQADAIAAGLLIHHFAKHVAQSTGFAVAAFAFAEGGKTAPDAITLGT